MWNRLVGFYRKEVAQPPPPQLEEDNGGQPCSEDRQPRDLLAHSLPGHPQSETLKCARRCGLHIRFALDPESRIETPSSTIDTLRRATIFPSATHPDLAAKRRPLIQRCPRCSASAMVLGGTRRARPTVAVGGNTGRPTRRVTIDDRYDRRRMLRNPPTFARRKRAAVPIQMMPFASFCAHVRNPLPQCAQTHTQRRPSRNKGSLPLIRVRNLGKPSLETPGLKQSPCIPLPQTTKGWSGFPSNPFFCVKTVVPEIGIEPTTSSLRMTRSTN